MLSRLSQVLSIGAIVAVTFGSALIGSNSSRHRGRFWYRLLRKSKANPPDAVFGPVWTLLYGLSATSASRVALSKPSSERNSSLALWGIQQLLNTAWSPLFFGKQKPRSALIDVVGLWLTLLALIRETRKIDRAASNMLLPYLGWVAFAAYLNYAIVKKNPKWLQAQGALPDRVTQNLRRALSPLLHS